MIKFYQLEESLNLSKNGINYAIRLFQYINVSQRNNINGANGDFLNSAYVIF